MGRIVYVVLIIVVTFVSVVAQAMKPLPQRWLYGFIDRDGKVIATPVFDSVGLFSENGLALVIQNKKAGFIDPRGEVVIPIRFDGADGFVNGMALVKIGEKFGYIDSSGGFAIQPTLHATPLDSMSNDCRRFSEIGLAAAEDQGKWGYINRTGQWAIAPQFDRVFPFNGTGYARVYLHGKGGIIDQRGEIVVPIAHALRGNMSGNGLVPVEVDGKSGYLGRDGQFAIPPKFERVWEFGYDAPKELAQACDESYCGFIDVTGAFVGKFDRSDFDWFGVEPKYSDGLVVIRSRKTFRFGNADVAGNIVIEPVFDGPLFFSADSAGSIAEKDGRLGYVNRSGVFSELSPRSLLNTESASKNTLVRFDVSGKYGYRNLSGEIVIPAKFDWTDGFDQFGIARIGLKVEGI